ncbi:MAG: hypothetical protein AB7T03_05570 [Bacilli bacterium]
MFKKLLFIFLLVFSVFGLIACDGGTTPEDIDTTESIDVPVNLAISEKVLTWDAVVDATGYIIYVNDEEKKTVTTTSYDFSALSGDNLIFQVVTKAPTGMNNSAKSTTIAYMANPQAEITAINIILDNMMPGAPEGVAEELVRKGTTGEDMKDLKGAFDVLKTDMEAAEDDPLLVNAAIKKFLATDINYEALASAGLIAMVPNLEEQIVNLQEDIDRYQDMIDQYGPDEYYQSQIDNYNSQKEFTMQMKTMITDSRDEMVLVAANTVNYLIDFQTRITDDLITKIQDIMEAEGPSELTADEIVLVKDEIVDLLMENLPSTADLALVYELLSTGYGQLLEANDFSLLLSESSASFAATTTLSIQFALKSLDSFDKPFFTKLLALTTDAPTEEVMASEIGILVVTYVKAFKDANQTLIDQIEAIFTDEQKEALYQGYMQTLATLVEKTDGEVSFSGLGTDLTYAIISGATDVFEDMMDKLTDKFVTTDGELLRKIVILNSFTSDWNWQTYEEENFRNEATGETYPDEDAFDDAKEAANFAVLKEAISYYAPTLGTLTNDQITDVIDMLVASVPIADIATQTEMTEAEVQAIADLAEALLRNVLPDLNTFVKNLMNYVVTNDLITKVQTLHSDIISYFVTKYGENYEENPAYWEDDYEENCIVIFVSKHVNAFFTSANQTLFRGLITDVATFAKNEDIYTLMDLVLADITEMEANVNTAFDDMISLANTIKGFNAATITTEQEATIQEFMDVFNNLFGGQTAKQ